jgi:hypothetical protein
MFQLTTGRRNPSAISDWWATIDGRRVMTLVSGCYSSRSVIAGSIREARQAGTADAAALTANRTTSALAKLTGSMGEMPRTVCANTRPSNTEPTSASSK